MNEQGQDRTVVLAVVVFLGLIALGGLAGVVFLVWKGVDASQLLAVSSVAGPASGALAGILASTRSAPPAPVQQAVGYKQAIDDVHAASGEPTAAAPSAF